MRRPPFLLVIGIVLGAVVAPLNGSLSAQRLGPPVDRPKLREVSDTNDARAYFDAGVALLWRAPWTAADAFYWAARLNPGWADPLYARRVALLLQNPTVLFEGMVNVHRRPKHPEVRRLDSLQLRALMLDPFLFRGIDRYLYLLRSRENDQTSESETGVKVQGWMQGAPFATRGRYWYSMGKLDRALEYDAEALKGHSDDAAYLHMERGRIFGTRNQVDSAVAEFTSAIAELRRRNANDLVVYYSKAQAELSIATLFDRTGKIGEARDAYRRALREDSTYHPAHLRLGLLALNEGDTATAVSELARAAQIATNEPYVHYTHGYVLTRVKRPAEAVTALKKALELEPYYALACLALGTQYEELGSTGEALAAYRRYLRLASREDARREFATGRVKELSSASR